MHPEGGDDLDWMVRHFVYAHIVEHERPPTVAEAAAGLDIALDRARAAFERLNARHALVLEPGSHNVRMANPFSTVPTGFRIHARGHVYWANCAWDMLGIPAALHADATIEAACADTADSHTPATLAVMGDAVRGQDEIVHFALPFRQWYDDLTRT
jgi:hypothetical protein